jgi:hypothetical protein
MSNSERSGEHSRTHAEPGAVRSARFEGKLPAARCRGVAGSHASAVEDLERYVGAVLIDLLAESVVLAMTPGSGAAAQETHHDAK